MTTPQKKIHGHWQRQYRQQHAPRQGESSFQLVLGESDLRILVGKEADDIPVLRDKMRHTVEQLRADISSWALLYPEFRTSLAPLPLPKNAPEIVQRMYAGAQAAGVGPFAAVAGTLAHMLAMEHVSEVADIIIENGGDVYMYSTKERVVALLAQPQDAHAYLGLRFSAEQFPLALCASSATIGHSLSLGNGELAVVLAHEGALADAVATAMGNRLRDAASVQEALDYGQSVDGVRGLFVQCDDAMGVWGAMELVAL